MFLIIPPSYVYQLFLAMINFLFYLWGKAQKDHTEGQACSKVLNSTDNINTLYSCITIYLFPNTQDWK